MHGLTNKAYVQTSPRLKGKLCLQCEQACHPKDRCPRRNRLRLLPYVDMNWMTKNFLASFVNFFSHSPPVIQNFLNCVTFANLDAIDQDMLEAEAAFFQGLAEARELELRANSDDPNAVVNDPLLNYYRGREALATNTAAELSAGSNEMDRLNTRMGYLKQISQMDQTYYSEMAEVAKLNGDADSQRTFESQASQASDREGQISRSWQTLMNMLSQGMIDANK